MVMTRFGTSLFAASLIACSSAFGQANDQTLADIRLELGTLSGQLQELRNELASTGATGTEATSSGPALLRVDAIEQELRRLTGKVEQLEFKVNQVVKDGTNRVGDLEFRLCELEETCDVMQAGRVPELGSNVVATEPTAAVSTTIPENNAELAISEKIDFETAFLNYQNGNFALAADGFAAFTQNYPGGPLTGDALYWRGESLASLEDWKSAARSFLDSFSGTPDGQFAPDALRRLGISLSQLDKQEEACQTLREVGNRFPSSEAASLAASDLGTLGCS